VERRVRYKFGWVAAVAAVMLSACTVQGPPGDPLSRQALWFRYLDGEDIRHACTPGAPDRYRLVFNADWRQQVRSYDLTPDGSGGAMMDTRVFGPGLLGARVNLGDLSGSVGGDKSLVRLGPDQVAALDRALVQAGLEKRPPVGKRLWSDAYYWVVTACRGGKVWFNVFDEDQPGYAGLPFPAVLYAADRTGVPVAKPGPYRERSFVGGDTIEEAPRFDIQVREQGLGYAR
jgi:hypothetical protein